MSGAPTFLPTCRSSSPEDVSQEHDIPSNCCVESEVADKPCAGESLLSSELVEPSPFSSVDVRGTDASVAEDHSSKQLGLSNHPMTPASTCPKYLPPRPSTSVFLLDYSFNQDCTCFVCATTAGFRVFTCTPLFEFMRREGPEWEHGGGCAVAEMLFRTNLFALVVSNDRRKVNLWDDRKQRLIGELRSRQEVISVCLGRDILAMVTEFLIYVYQSEQMRPFSILHTGSNLRGLCVVAAGSQKGVWRIACPAVAVGVVRVEGSEGDQVSHAFRAHKAPLANLAFNTAGTLVGTASETGTVVRVFSALDGTQLHELRRGTSHHSVSCLAFRADNAFLAVASSSATVHIFKLSTASPIPPPGTVWPNGLPTGSFCEDDDDVRERTGSGSSQGASRETVAASVVSSVVSHGKDLVQDAVKGVMPKYFNAARSFAQFRIPTSELATDVRLKPSIPSPDSGAGITESKAAHSSPITGPLCAFAGDRSNHIYVVHHNGVFYECHFDPNLGNDCATLTSTPWFATRPEFKLQVNQAGDVLPSETEGDGDDWQLVL